MPTRRAAAAAGLVAGALATTTAELVAAITDTPSPIAAVGTAVIERAPTWLERWAIDTLGTWDKPALRLGIVVLLSVAALALGVAAARRRRWVVPGFAAFAVIGASVGTTVASVIGAALGSMALLRLLVRPIEVPGPSQAPLGWDRRRFLVAGTGVAVVAAGAGTAARAIGSRRVTSTRQQADIALPAVDDALRATVPEGVELSPTSPFLTPNDRFYRIDTALSLPRVNLPKWRLRIGGMVDRPFALTYDDLLARTQHEHLATICCVSNEVGGEYVGTARWQGIPLRSLLDEAGVQPSAEQVFSTSLDGWTCGFPVAAALDGRDAMLVLGMNGAPLPLEHGFPARLVVPGLYGYVSATKWLESIELTTWDQQGYWVPRGWSRLGPVKTQSRIDVPRRGARLPAGTTAVAGVAWAPHRGIDAVEVQIDDAPWQMARLGTDAGDDTWRQWLFQWEATPGEHIIRVRATDGDGRTQTAERSPVAPDGATGHHTIKVRVD